MNILRIASFALLASALSAQNYVPMTASMSVPATDVVRLDMAGGPATIDLVLIAAPGGEGGTVNLPGSRLATTQTSSGPLHTVDIAVPNAAALCGFTFDVFAVQSAPFTVGYAQATVTCGVIE